MSGIRITRLYRKELDFGGDRGNIEALRLRSRRAGLEVDYVEHGIGDGAIAPSDLLVLGTGPASVIDRVLDDAREHREELAAIVASGAPVLAIGTGAEVLSESITALDGVQRDGLGILPMTAERTRDRRIGYVVAESPVGELIGFEDHASRWSAGAGTAPFGTVRVGRGIVRFDDRWAVGLRAGDIFAMQLQGPLLPLNPRMTDQLLSLAAIHAGIEYAGPREHEPVDDYAAGVRDDFREYVKGKDLRYIRL
ncbi:MAG: hypothetical protein M3Y46_08145 [Actinomycetota bacterium]|nr:hypothetical protein [Actinomycetota bacterium]